MAPLQRRIRNNRCKQCHGSVGPVRFDFTNTGFCVVPASDAGRRSGEEASHRFQASPPPWDGASENSCMVCESGSRRMCRFSVSDCFSEVMLASGLSTALV